MFPNSVSSPWELLKDLVYLPYWQLYGELNLEQIEGTEPSKCTKDPQLYTNGTMDRCPEKTSFNMIMPAVYLILTNILLVNIIIAIFSQTFQNVQNNSEMIYKFHRYALVYEYHDRPMFPIPIVIHLWRIILFWYDKRGPTKDILKEIDSTPTQQDIKGFTNRNARNERIVDSGDSKFRKSIISCSTR
ncbi:TRPM3 [Mytilus edulis]|uniref:TRPM3 n=1 Tax=Mytilus edulis TaxID=6550 RepID=A0A8S3RZ65_MYTED|nr:TRPM3 [Mytilus edulis]